MYNINHNQDLNCLEIKSFDNSLDAKIYLNDGASLQKLTLNNHAIIEDLSPLLYKNTYASSILFPFANRIKDGTYPFEGEIHKFEINEPDNNNALHGLVFNKTFEVIDSNTDANSASVSLEYNETNKSVGFPYTYSIQLDYSFSKNGLTLKTTVKNTSSVPFPFTLGWHPYFVSENLSKSYLKFNSSKKLVFDDRMITSKTEDITTSSIKVNDNQLDDCWVLDNTKVIFETPEYNLQMLSSEKNSFLQAYTPPQKNTIAIEPTTGVSNSFNNKIGLQTLASNESYQITWTLKLD